MLVNIVNAHVSIVKYKKQIQIQIEKIRLVYLPMSQICFSGFGTEQLPPHSSFFTITKDLVFVPFVPQPVHALHAVGANWQFFGQHIKLQETSCFNALQLPPHVALAVTYRVLVFIPKNPQLSVHGDHWLQEDSRQFVALHERRRLKNQKDDTLFNEKDKYIRKQTYMLSFAMLLLHDVWH